MPNELFTRTLPVNLTIQIGYAIEGRDLVVSIQGNATPIRLPLDWFSNSNGEVDAEHVGSYVRDLEYYLELSLANVLIDSAALHVNDAANLLATEQGLNPQPPREVFAKLAQQHKEAAMAYCLEFTNLAASNGDGRGRFSEWTPLTLSLAIQGAMAELNYTNITYETVNNKLREHHKSKAPHSANALKTLVHNFNVNWKQLKTPSKPDPFAMVRFMLSQAESKSNKPTKPTKPAKQKVSLIRLNKRH